MEDNMEKSSKKKKNPIVKFLLGILIFLLVIILVLSVWFIYSALDKQNSLSMLPVGYSTYLRTDSTWDAIDPLIDLQAADILLSSPEFSQFREPFMALRSSTLRTNKLFTTLLSRRVDGALYSDENSNQYFTALIDLGFLSGITRPSKYFIQFVIDKIGLEGFSVKENHYEYKNGNSIYYIKPVKNLVLVSSSKELFDQALTCKNDENYTEEEKEMLLAKPTQLIKVVVDARQLALSLTEQIPVFNKIASMLSRESLSVLSFGITDEQININADFPFAISDELEKMPGFSGLSKILEKNSTMPKLISSLSDDVQYYTIIKAGSIQELKTAVFPLMPSEMNLNSLWMMGDTLCSTIFGATLDEIICSWTGDEFAVVGIEGLNDPVFVMQISDEKQRKKIFDKIISSIIINDDTSLILDGVRLPRLEFPGFLQGLLKSFDINLPNPYYMIKDGFIYFSTAPETLLSIHTSLVNGNKISKNENWKVVSTNQKNNATISLFYDLARSIPFFLRGNNYVSKILQLYTIGRCDIRIEDSVLKCQLQANSKRAGSLKEIPGYPISLSGTSDYKLYLSPIKNSNKIFWIEDNNKIKMMNISSMEVTERKIDSSKINICTAKKELSSGGVLWVTTSEGNIFLLNENLEDVANFPIMISGIPSGDSSSFDEGLIIPLEKKLCYVYLDGKEKIIDLPITGSIKSNPTVLNKNVAIYDKSFAGKIFVLENDVCINQENPFMISGIAFGSPSLLKSKSNLYTGFINQAGNLYIWSEKNLRDEFPKKLDGVFYSNLVNNGKYFYAVSSVGEIFRIDVNGNYISVKIPNISVKEGYITVASQDNGVNNIYLTTDGNVIYGFNENLELLSGFPLAGCGVPIFTDVNGDRILDCLVQTIDKKINAWNLR